MGNTNSTPRIPGPLLPKPPPAQYANYIVHISPEEKAWVLAALGDNRLEKAKAILSSIHIPNPGLLLDDNEMSSAIEDCITQISANKVNEGYLSKVVEAIVDRVRKEPMEVEYGVEQVLFIASSLVRGEACGLCGEDCRSSAKQSGGTCNPQIFVDAIDKLDNIAHGKQIRWSTSHRGNFMLGKLYQIHPEFESIGWIYRPSDASGQPIDDEEIEQMWCGGYDGVCGCWEGECDIHSQQCPLCR